MTTTKTLILILSLLLFAGCGGGSAPREDRAANHADTQADGADNPPEAREQAKQFSTKGEAQPAAVNVPMQRVSLKEADQSQTVAEAVDRKIIKDAELTLEVNSPSDSQRTVESIAETQGGFVVTSEAKQRQSNEPSQRLLDITLVIRIPAARFGPTVDQIRAVSNNVLDAKKTGQDVTEEFIDIEARIKTQKALEAQFLEIMKQAHKVEDALEVQTQIAEVRTQIEKLEGRKRFLQNRSSLSTITVHLQSPTTVVVAATTGFGRDVKEALRDSVDVARGIILFLIRFVIVMIPIFLFIILPLGLVARYLWRRAARKRPTPIIPVAPVANAQQPTA
jgi:preprotein translocase subunit SecG